MSWAGLESLWLQLPAAAKTECGSAKAEKGESEGNTCSESKTNKAF